MRHRILTCANHPELRWSTKDVAWTAGIGYNGQRSLFFSGKPSGRGMHPDMSGLDCDTIIIEPAPDCQCRACKIQRCEVEGLTRPCESPKVTVIAECDCDTDQLILVPEDELVRR